MVPSSAIVGELFPLLYRDSGKAVKNNEEAHGIALPPELLEKFQAYFERNGGILEHARRLIYGVELLRNNEHRLGKLNGGVTWGCECPNNMNIHHKPSSILDRSSSHAYLPSLTT